MRLDLAAATLGVLAFASSTLAATVTLTTADGGGEDTFLHRGKTTDYSSNVSLAAKKQFESEDSGNDRIGLLKFDTSSLAGAGPITDVTLTLQTSGTMSTGNNGNSFLGGHVVHLYGVPDGHADEAWDPASVTFANFGFTTGASAHHARPAIDTAINSIDDTLAILLGRFTFPDEPNLQPIGLQFSFSTVPLAQFLAADTNGVVSFILASMTDGPGQVPTVHSAQSTTPGAIVPTLQVQTTGGTEPIVPEPTTAALLALGAGVAGLRRRVISGGAASTPRAA